MINTSQNRFSIKKIALITSLSVLGGVCVGEGTPSALVDAQAVTATASIPDGLANAAQLALVTQLGLLPKTDILVGDIHADSQFAYGIVAIPNNLINGGSAPRVYWFAAHKINSQWQVVIEHTAEFYALIQAIPASSNVSQIAQYIGSSLPKADLIDKVQQTITEHLRLSSQSTAVITDVKVDGNFALGNFIIPSIEYSGLGPVNNELFSAVNNGQGWQVGLQSEPDYRNFLIVGEMRDTSVPATQNYIPPGVSPDLIASAQKSLIAYLGYTPKNGIWVNDIKAGQNVAAGTLLLPADNPKVAPRTYTFIAARVNQSWQVAFPFTADFYQILSNHYFPLQMISLQDRQYLLPLDDMGTITRAAQQAFITYLGSIPDSGFVVGGVQIDHGFAVGNITVLPLPDPDSGPQLYSFIAQQTGQSWDIAFKWTAAYNAMLSNIPVTLISAQDKQYYLMSTPSAFP